MMPVFLGCYLFVVWLSSFSHCLSLLLSCAFSLIAFTPELHNLHRTPGHCVEMQKWVTTLGTFNFLKKRYWNSYFLQIAWIIHNANKAKKIKKIPDTISMLLWFYCLLLLPFPMTRVNCPAMSPSEMGVAEESPSQGGGLWVWKLSEVGSLSAPVFVPSEEDAAASEAVAVSVVACVTLGGL